jgi:hypothetical protein
MEQPNIIQTLFTVDQNRKYLFDVNQNITIKKLKMILVAAAGLNKVGLRIFHNGKEYTDYDESTLDKLFPNLNYIEFYLQYSYDNVEDLDEIIDLKFKQYCPDHYGKYPYFYCYTCGKSFCSDCLRSGIHNNHETKEKYDYLQESKNLVELLFKDLKDIFKNTKGVNDESIEELKAKVSIQFFPKLIEMVKQIEQKMMNLILFFFEKEKGNFKTIENNVNLLKNHCEEGLDKLKKEIVIEDMMIDENVFLTFDSKFKEIGNEKEKFKEDIAKYKQFSETLYLIQNIIEKTYKEIYDFLLKYLNVTEFEDIKNQINSQNINVVDKKKIFDKLLSNIKKRSSAEPIGNTYYLRSSKVPPNTNEFMVEDNPKGQKMNYLLKSAPKDNNSQNNNISSIPFISNNQTNYDNNNNNLGNASYFTGSNYNNFGSNNNQFNNNDSSNYGTSTNILRGKNNNITNNDYSFSSNQNNPLNNNYSTYDNNNNYSFNKYTTYTNNNNNNNYSTYENNNNNNFLDGSNYGKKTMLSEVKESERMYEEEEESSHGPTYQVVCNLVPPKNQVILYNVNLDQITRKNIEFPTMLGIRHFLSECAWVNNNNKLYILGGIDDDNNASKIFLEYDPIKGIIRRLAEPYYPHSRHSLFAYNNQIFVVGGDGLECEKYDIINNQWSTLPNLSFKQVYPVLYVHNDILYSFFGINENERKTDDAQKLILKNNRGKWTKVIYKRNGCDLKVYGCGIAKTNDNCVLFLGGMDDKGIRKDAIQFDFSDLSASKTEFMLEENAYFKDSVLLKLSPKVYGNFSIEETNPFLKIKFQVRIH